MLLFANKYKAGKDLKKYNTLQCLETASEKPVLNPASERQTLAKYIHDNYHKMDESEMKHIVTKFLDINDVKDILICFEFNNYKVESKLMTLDEFIPIALNTFKKYYRAGGYFLEDRDWITHKSDSKRFDVSANEVMFQNTVNKLDVDDCNDFLERIVEILNNTASNIDVTFDLVKKKKITYVTIWAKMYNDDDSDDNVVGL
jgi:hypothetical protein